jgi:uncharacterized membrane protein YcaP (DUF421 family)
VDSVLRALAVYAFLILLFRISGKRSLAQITTFDLVLGLIISEALQQAMIDGDDSMTNAFLVVTTLIGANIFMSNLKQRSEAVERVVDGAPVVIYADGRLLTDRMARERVDEEDILQAGRQLLGLSSLDQVRYAVVERDGTISVVPKQGVSA